MEEFNGVGVTRENQRRFTPLPSPPFPETIFSYSMYSGSMDCRVCSNNIKGIVMAKERMENGGRGGAKGRSCGDQSLIYRVPRRTKSSSKGKTIRKERKIVEHAIFHLVLSTSPDILGRFFPVSLDDGREEGDVVVGCRFAGKSSRRCYCGTRVGQLASGK